MIWRLFQSLIKLLIGNIFREHLFKVSMTYRVPDPTPDEFRWATGICWDEKVLNLSELLGVIWFTGGFDNFKINATKQVLRVIKPKEIKEVPEHLQDAKGLQVFLNISGEPDSMKKLSNTMVKQGASEGYRYISRNTLFSYTPKGKKEIEEIVPDEKWDEPPSQEPERSLLFGALNRSDIMEIFPILVKYSLWKPFFGEKGCEYVQRYILLALGFYRIESKFCEESEQSDHDWHWDALAICKDDFSMKAFVAQVEFKFWLEVFDDMKRWALAKESVVPGDGLGRIYSHQLASRCYNSLNSIVKNKKTFSVGKSAWDVALDAASSMIAAEEVANVEGSLKACLNGYIGSLSESDFPDELLERNTYPKDSLLSCNVYKGFVFRVFIYI